MMFVVYWAIRLLLAAVFLVAGIAKLADRSGALQAFQDFGLRASFGRILSVLLPMAELLTAALLSTSFVLYGAGSAALLLGAFAVAISLQLAKGRKPNCHCFGQLHSAPVGPAVLARNIALAAVAGLLTWASTRQTFPSLWAWTDGHQLKAGALGSAVALALLVQAIFLLNLYRQHGRLLLRLDGLEKSRKVTAGSEDGYTDPNGLAVGTIAPDFVATALSGGSVTLHDLLSLGNSVLLVFIDPNCGPCHALLPELLRWQHEHAGILTVTIISRGSHEDNASTVPGDNTNARLIVQRDREISEAYGCSGTPGALLVGLDGRISSPIAVGAPSIRGLVEAFHRNSSV